MPFQKKKKYAHKNTACFAECSVEYNFNSVLNFHSSGLEESDVV